jgi:hypothetical protein
MSDGQVGPRTALDHLERFEIALQLCCPPIETTDDDGSDSIPLFHINTKVSAQTCLIFGVDREGVDILWHQLVWAEAVRGATWPICHSEPRVSSLSCLQIADGVVKDRLMIAAQAFFDRSSVQVTGLHPNDGCDVLAMLEANLVTCIYSGHPFLDELYLFAGFVFAAFVHLRRLGVAIQKIYTPGHVLYVGKWNGEESNRVAHS